MLDWEKINARLEKEREIKWLRKIKNIDETEEIQDFILTDYWGFSTKQLSPKTLGILYARFEVVPESDELLSVDIVYNTKNDFRTNGAQLTIDSNFETYFDKYSKDIRDLYTTNLLYKEAYNYSIYYNNDLSFITIYEEFEKMIKIKKDETGQGINGQTGFTIFSDIESQEIFITRYMPIKKDSNLSHFLKI